MTDEDLSTPTTACFHIVCYYLYTDSTINTYSGAMHHVCVLLYFSAAYTREA